MIGVPSIRRRRVLRHAVGGGVALYSFFNGLGARAATGGRPPLILIDPGHGGHDPGTTGVSGTLEKDVTLTAAQTLKASLAGIGLIRVELTRTRDRYVALEHRAEMAHDLGAGLLISLHADAISDPSIRGASVYTLARHASDDEAEALSGRENGTELPADRVTPEVADILASLAEHEVRAASSRLAHEVVRDLERGLPVLPSPERQANFTVLHTPDIPSMLVEMGFLSNPDDEAALLDPGHQALIAGAIARAVGGWIGRG